VALVAAAILAPSLATTLAQEQRPAATTIDLRTVTPKPGFLRLGYGVRGTIPAEVLELKVGSHTFLLVDLDGDAAITTTGRDGIALEGYPFVVPLGPELLCELGQCELRVDAPKKTATLTPETFGLDEELREDAALITEIRIRAGLPPVRLDGAACRGLEKHFDYLARNGEADGHTGLGMHDEKVDKPGYSREGDAAGGCSDLASGTRRFRDALWDWYMTAWHGSPLFDPGLKRVGVSWKHGCAGIYFVDQTMPGEPPVVHPADGEIDVPCTSLDELPSSYPRGASNRTLGYPVIVRLPALPYDWRNKLKSFTLTTGTGAPVHGTKSSPDAPANKAELPDNAQIALFLPASPLAPLTKFKARVEVEGKPILAWSFTTGAK
jgi:hypothetical protein